MIVCFSDYCNSFLEFGLLGTNRPPKVANIGKIPSIDVCVLPRVALTGCSALKPASVGKVNTDWHAAAGGTSRRIDWAKVAAPGIFGEGDSTRSSEFKLKLGDARVAAALDRFSITASARPRSRAICSPVHGRGAKSRSRLGRAN